jgi:hypothetical protein
MKIENRLSTLTNEIKENLSLLGEKLLTSRREILLLGSVRESIMTPSKTSSEKKIIDYHLKNKSFPLPISKFTEHVLRNTRHSKFTTL